MANLLCAVTYGSEGLEHHSGMIPSLSVPRHGAPLHCSYFLLHYSRAAGWSDDWMTQLFHYYGLHALLDGTFRSYRCSPWPPVHQWLHTEEPREIWRTSARTRVPPGAGITRPWRGSPQQTAAITTGGTEQWRLPHVWKCSFPHACCEKWICPCAASAISADI